MFAFLVLAMYLNSAFGLFSALRIYSLLDSQPEVTLSLTLYTQGRSAKHLQKIIESLNSQLYCILKILVWILEHSLIYFPPTNL